jgi:hypothetical protein
MRATGHEGNMMGGIGIILLAVMAAYLLALATLYMTQRSKVFPASKMKPEIAATIGAEAMREVVIAGEDGVGLVSWYASPTRHDRRTIIYFHGNAGNIGGRLERVIPYLAQGYGVLLVGYPGYGGNPGQPSEQAFYRTARANLDFLQAEGVSGDRLILFGESLGTAVAIQMATERKALALILEAPLASVHLSAQARYPLLAFDFLVRDKFASIDKIVNVHMPLLIVHGELDRTTNVRFGRLLLARANAPKRGFFPASAGHNDLMQHGMPETVIGFLDGLVA